MSENSSVVLKFMFIINRLLIMLLVYVTGSTIMRNKSGHVNAGKTTSKFVGVIFH